MAFLLKFSFFFLATIETMSNKKEKILLVTHNQECKNIYIYIEGYMHFLVSMKHAYIY